MELRSRQDRQRPGQRGRQHHPRPAGTYTNDFSYITHKITLQAVGGMVASGPIANGKAMLIVDTDVTIDHFAFSGATVRDGNGAGIRYTGGNLLITNSLFANNQNGVTAAIVALPNRLARWAAVSFVGPRRVRRAAGRIAAGLPARPNLGCSS